MLKIILLGPPGSGKGTQATRLSQEYNIPHISTGDLFRQHITMKTSIGLEAQAFIQAGQLVPDSVVLAMAFERLSQPDCKEGFLLDGFPRTLLQAEQLLYQQSLQSSVYPLVVIALHVPDEEIIKRITSRLLCRNCHAIYNQFNSPPKVTGICDKCKGVIYQRNDDTIEVIRQRLKVYHEQTQPLLKFYQEKQLLIVFDGMQSPENVYQEIKQTLSN